MKYITINTDASYDTNETNTGGYAFYIVCDLFKIQKGGMFKNNPTSSLNAEVMAIGNAVATLLVQKDIKNTGNIVINCDCIPAFTRIKKGVGIGKEVATLINKLKKITGAEISFRHVKAHNGTHNARSWVNDWCDKEAKKWMKLAKYERQKNNNTIHG